jgi:hypothetical protein
MLPCRLLLILLASGLLAAGARAQDNRAGWPAEKTVGVFHCHADYVLGRDELLLAQLDDLARDVTSTLGLLPSREPIHLFLFHDRETYQAYLKQHFPRVPYRRALFIKSKGPGMVFAFKGDAFEIDVRHECTHAVLHSVVQNLPLWLDEGLAEYFEVIREQRAVQNPHLDAIRKESRTSTPRPLEKLEALKDFGELGREEYRDSFAWVHFLLHGPRTAHEELVNYLADQQAARPTESLSARLRRRLPEVERRVAEHFRSAQDPAQETRIFGNGLSSSGGSLEERASPDTGSP